MSDRVTVTVDDGIGEVALNRAEKRNALDLAMFESLIAAQRELAEAKGLRAVILRGQGPAFCAGIDVKAFTAGPEMVARLLAPAGERTATVAQQVAVGWRELPVPVIAALHGSVFGAGLQIALGADLRLAAGDAELSVMEIRWGIIPDMGITATARQLLPMDVTLELAWTGRVFGAEEALRLGLVTRLVEEPVVAARSLAEELVTRSPDALAAIKTLFLEVWMGDTSDGLGREVALQKQLLGTPNQVEAVRANLEKRDPRFTTG